MATAQAGRWNPAVSEVQWLETELFAMLEQTDDAAYVTESANLRGVNECDTRRATAEHDNLGNLPARHCVLVLEQPEWRARLTQV